MSRLRVRVDREEELKKERKKGRASWDGSHTHTREGESEHQRGAVLKGPGSTIIYMICCYLKSRERERRSKKTKANAWPNCHKARDTRNAY
jgi:hypothetical protein